MIKECERFTYSFETEVQVLRGSLGAQPRVFDVKVYAVTSTSSSTSTGTEGDTFKVVIDGSHELVFHARRTAVLSQACQLISPIS